MAIFLILMHRFNAIPIGIPGGFVENDKLILKFTRKLKGLRITKIILGGGEKVDSHFPISKLITKQQ